MGHEHKSTWKCQLCRCKTPKIDNTNSPARPEPHYASKPSSSAPSLEVDNVTKRKISGPRTHDISSDSESSQSVLGDTLVTEGNSDVEGKLCINSITLNQLEQILESKLEKNKASLLSELKTIIIDEITTEIMNQIQPNLKLISTEQQWLKDEIKTINMHIEQLQNENLKLQLELKNIQDNMHPLKKEEGKWINQIVNSKKIVLYGLKEDHWETEEEVTQRVIYAFQSVMNINLEEYIESLNRIGKKGYTRPLVIELLSKKAVRYILQNKQYFRKTGLAVSEYLDEDQRKTRNHLRKILKEARNDGKHAVIINNRLIINGKEYTQKEAQSNRTTASQKCSLDETKLNPSPETLNVSLSLSQSTQTINTFRN